MSKKLLDKVKILILQKNILQDELERAKEIKIKLEKNESRKK